MPYSARRTPDSDLTATGAANRLDTRLFQSVLFSNLFGKEQSFALFAVKPMVRNPVIDRGGC
jgi:hypothetical protein